MPSRHDKNHAIEKAARTVANNAKDFSAGLHNLVVEEQTGNCPGCGQPLEAGAAVCPFCGYDTKIAAVPEGIAALAKGISGLDRKRQAVEEAVYTSFSVRLDGSVDTEALTIRKEESGGELTLFLTGHLDTATAPLLEAELQSSLGGIKSLLLDFEELEYITSVGMRVLLSTQKIMNRQGCMKIVHANDVVMDTFIAVGFSDIMTIE